MGTDKTSITEDEIEQVQEFLASAWPVAMILANAIDDDRAEVLRRVVVELHPDAVWEVT